MTDIPPAAQETTRGVRDIAGGIDLLIVTGLTGAGRSTAAHALEDIGWYVVDNVPPAVVQPSIAQVRAAGIRRLALVLDVRVGRMFSQLGGVFESLRHAKSQFEVLFLEADSEVLVRRQSSARRPHPLQGDGSLLDGVEHEREQLADLRAGADMVIDTSRLNPHQLVARVAHAYGGEVSERLRVLVMSFGFKNGVPVDADLVFDVRFLPNPHWLPDLRPQTGLDAPVRDYVLRQPAAAPFLDQVLGLLQLQRPGYVTEGKRTVTVAVGCTGGKHRSTAVAEQLAARLRDGGIPARTVHRDLGLE